MSADTRGTSTKGGATSPGRNWCGEPGKRRSAAATLTHGETYLNAEERLWWSKGGKLVGESPARFRFLRQIYSAAPDGRLDPLPSDWDAPCAGGEDSLIYYFGFNQPKYRTIWTPRDTTWAVDVIDTWHMSITTLPAAYSGRFTVSLPGRQYIALRLRQI